MKYDCTLLEKLSSEELKVLSSDLRSDIMEATQRFGGHLSSNLGAVEMTISLLRNFDPYKDDILFDVGHQTYAYKILTGRPLNNLRQIDGEPPFSSPDLSKADKYYNGHAGTSISTAFGMALSKNIEGDESYTVAVIGDASIVNGMAMEALSLLSTSNAKVIIVLNDNGMSIGRDVSFLGRRFQKLRNSLFYYNASSFLGRTMRKNKISRKIFSALKSFKDSIRRIFLGSTIFENMGLKYIGPYDGNDIESVDLALRKAKASIKDGPVVVHLVTEKGYGYPPASKDEEGKFHGVSSGYYMDDEKDSSSAMLAVKRKYLLDLFMNDRQAVLITPAMAYGSDLSEIFEKYPDRCFDVGIAEEHAVTLACGLALKGMHPVVDIYSTFLQRAYDQVIEDVSRSKVPVLFFVERAGLVGEDGASHHGIYDVAYLRSIPNVDILMPYSPDNLSELLKESFFDKNKATFIRLEKDCSFGTGLTIFDVHSHPSLVISLGQVGKRIGNLLKEYADIKLITNLNDMKKEMEGISFDRYNDIFFYDPYSTKEGSEVAFKDYLFDSHYTHRYHSFVLPTQFIPHGKTEELLKRLELHPDIVCEKIKNIIVSYAPRTTNDGGKKNG